MRTNIVYSFVMAQNVSLKAKLQKRDRSKSVLGQSFRVVPFKLLKGVCDLVWDTYLLEISIFEMKVPLTTLKCLSRKYITRKHNGYALISNVEERMLRVASVKKISNYVCLLLSYLFQGLKEVWGALVGSYDQYGIEKSPDQSIDRFLSPDEAPG